MRTCDRCHSLGITGSGAVASVSVRSPNGGDQNFDLCAIHAEEFMNWLAGSSKEDLANRDSRKRAMSRSMKGR